MKPLTPRLLVLTFTAVVLSACVRQPQSGFVYRDWSARMREMGIFPVFPPREDIHVGDVYLLPTHPYDAPLIETIGGAGNSGFHKQNIFFDLGRSPADAQSALTDYYHARPVFDGTEEPVDFDGEPITRLEGPAPDLSGRTSVFERALPTRLKQVAFPDFSVTTVTEAGVAAVVPIEAIRASLGFASSDISSISFKIPRAESYGLPSDYLLRDLFLNSIITSREGQIFLDCPTGPGKSGVIAETAPALARAMFDESARFIEQSIRDPGQRVRFRRSWDRSRDYVILSVISEVYYARAMDISIEFRKARTTSASARVLSLQELQELKNFLQGSGSGSSAQNAGGSDSDSGSEVAIAEEIGEEGAVASTGDAGAGKASTSNPRVNMPGDSEMSILDLARKLKEENIELTGNVPGGQVKIVSVGARSVGVRRTFEQPIAVGVRGLLLKLELTPVEYFTPDDRPRRGFRIVTSSGR